MSMASRLRRLAMLILFSVGRDGAN